MVAISVKYFSSKPDTSRFVCDRRSFNYSGQLREVAAQKSLSALQIWLDIITMLDKILIPEGEGIVRKGGHLVDLKNDEITTL